MERLLFLLISIVLTGIFIYAIPLGFTRIDKNILVLASSFIGAFGLISVHAADLWQVLSLMVLLGVSTGYIIVNRSSSAKVTVPLSGRLNSRTGQLVDEFPSETKGIEEEKEMKPIEVFTIINPENEQDEELQIVIEDDILFLDERSRIHIPAVEWDQPVANIERDRVREPENEKLYASTHI